MTTIMGGHKLIIFVMMMNGKALIQVNLPDP